MKVRFESAGAPRNKLPQAICSAGRPYRYRIAAGEGSAGASRAPYEYPTSLRYGRGVMKSEQPLGLGILNHARREAVG